MMSRPRLWNLVDSAQQLVRADHDVHGAVADALDGGGDLLARAEARHLGHLHRPFGKAVTSVWWCCSASSVVGARKATCLPPVTATKARAQGHFGLAEAHVAADQPVHGAGEIMSWMTAWMAAFWSAVSSKPKSLANCS